MNIMSFTKDYVGGFILNAVKSFLPITCGVSKSAFDVNNAGKYGVSITTTTPEGYTRVEINAWLQEKMEMNVSSDWKKITYFDIPDIVQDVFEGVTKKSILSTPMSRRKWRGSTPVEITLKLKFEAVEDVFKEVTQPTFALQALALPSQNTMTKDFFLQPPGPNPFRIIKNNKVSETEEGVGEHVKVSLGGGFLTFKDVVVKNVKVVYENRMSEKGPIGATAEITFETYEMLTRESLAEAYGIYQNMLTIRKII